MEGFGQGRVIEWNRESVTAYSHLRTGKGRLKHGWKDRERDIRILQVWSRINRNRDPCSVWVHLRGELGKTLEHLEADGSEVEMGGEGNGEK